MEEIKLLGTAASSFVNRVQFVLNLKSIEYKFIEENLACKSDLLLASNPVLKKIPILLKANEPPICESLIIIEYLEEIKPDIHPILPPKPSDRAKNRFWANYIDNKFFPLYLELSYAHEREIVKDKIIKESQLLEEVFVKFSNGKAYFGGDEVGYLDVVLGCFLGWTKFHEKRHDFKVFDEVRTPKLAEWVKRILSHKAITGVMPQEDILMDYYMMRLK
ncbi:glutathione S-transferase U17 [Lactuca sativa]|uniref:Glutathione S-transferase n=1 Tax=Lactuca sativa TaxID=4236 RepID=A0A9R1VXG9_LACSA|nr:glutathione S-transferase U17 [Lactuca sativa]KAJ0215752.1 hypothetical protein LSAT_V11C300121350 [Lactuca sativa]